MFNRTLSFPKNGFFFNRPDWRYLMLEQHMDPTDPSKFRMHIRKAVRTISDTHWNTDGGTYLRRFVKIDDTGHYTPNTRLSEDGQRVYNMLSPEEQQVFRRFQLIQLRSEGKKKMSYTKSEKLPKMCWEWRLKYIDYVTDEPFQRLIKHCTSFKYDKWLAEAIVFKQSPSNDTVIKKIGEEIYTGETDVQIASHYRMRAPQIEALRVLFFDYSRMPKDVVANAAYLRQMVNNNVHDETGFNTRKQCNQLGRVALKARADLKLLNEVEMRMVLNNVKAGVIEKLFFLEQAVRTSSDAQKFISTVVAQTNLNLEDAKAKALDAHTTHIKAKTRQVEATTPAGSDGAISTDKDALALLDTIYELTLVNPEPPDIKSLDELQKD